MVANREHLTIRMPTLPYLTGQVLLNDVW